MKYTIRPVSRRTALTLASLTALTLAACSQKQAASESGTQPPAAPSTESPSPSQSPTETPTPTSTPSTTATPTANDPSTPPTHSADDVTPSAPPAEGGTLTNTQGRDLTRTDLFNPSAALKEDLYNVATSSKKKGIGAYLRYSDGVEAELRLENRFHKLTFNAGQDNNSLSSDLILRVEIYKDRKSDQFVDIPFNEIKPIEVDVTNVNALKIDLIPLNQDGSKYRDSNSITAVMFDMRLE